jgi:hypothetical protein
MLKWSIDWNFVLFKLGNEQFKDKICAYHLATILGTKTNLMQKITTIIE